MFGRKSKGAETKGVLAEGVRINGNITFSGKVRIDGEVMGNVKGDYVVFGPSSKVDGNIEADTVIMFGELKGNIKGKSVELRAGSRIEGDIECNELTVEVGSVIRGKVMVEPVCEDMSQFEGSKAEEDG